MFFIFEFEIKIKICNSNKITLLLCAINGIIYSMFEKPTNAMSIQVVMDYYKGVMEKSGESGQMDPDTFR